MKQTSKKPIILIFDIETDGLLLELTTMWVGVTKNKRTKEIDVYRDPYELTETLNKADLIVGHNILGFDLPALFKLTGIEVTTKVVDTLLLARLAYYDKVWSHSLDAYGERLGHRKGVYSDWSKYSKEMEEYCIQDVEVTDTLYTHLKRKAVWLPEEALEIEQDVQKIITQQYLNGWKFDIKKGERLHVELVKEKEVAEQALWKTFKPRFLPKGQLKTPTKKFTRLGVTTVGPHQPVTYTLFNPGSGSHIIWWVESIYGKQQWVFPDAQEIAKRDREAKIEGKKVRRGPTTWVGKLLKHPDNAKTDSDTLIDMFSNRPYLKPLIHYLEVTKLLGQLAEGPKAWLKLVATDGRIHGQANILGAVTGRFTHSNPNIGQVPSVRAYKGKEARTLFTVEDGYSLVGADASGLELRTLSHYLARYDKGTYGQQVLEGDIHTANQTAAGLPTRDMAKTFIYGFLYGAGDAKIGQITKGGKEGGKKLKARFLKKTLGLSCLVSDVKRAAKKKYLRGLSGRRLAVRSPHSALNTLLQSAGAYFMKYWLVAVDDLIKEKGFDAKFVGNIHDEIQVEVRTDQAELFAKHLERLFPIVGEQIGMRLKMEGEAKVGKNWADTH